jgi:hypothetical protein
MSDPLLTALIASILGLVGTIAGVLVAGALKAREARRAAAEAKRAAAEEARRTAEEAKIGAMIAMATSLNNEWHKGVTSKARPLAWALLRKEWNLMLRDIEQKHPDDFTWIWAMLEFFANLHHEIVLGAIKEEDVVGLFGEPIVWWWIVGFSKRAESEEFCSYDAMSSLSDWLGTFCRGSIHEAEYQKWVDGAKATRIRNTPPDTSTRQ